MAIERGPNAARQGYGRRACAGALVVLLAALMTGCTTSSAPKKTPATPAVALPTAVPVASAAQISRDERALLTEGFSPESYRVSRLSHGRVIVIFHSVCTGSADGHCQAVTVFATGFRKAIWQRQYAGVESIAPKPDGFAVTAATYRRNDPLCCPSLPPKTRNFTWNGSRFVPRT